VVVWDLDGLHRRPVELEHFIDLADEKHLALASVGGDADLSTDNGRLFARIKEAVARAEIERKSARQKRAARQAAEAGKSWGNRAFGYRKTGELVEAEAIAVEEAYGSVLLGASLSAIATRWNQAGLRTSFGNSWTSTSVKCVMVNPRYMGQRAYLGTIVAPAEWPAVVSEEEWRAVQDVLARRSREPYPIERKYVLTGLARCGNCGGKVSSSWNCKRAVYVCKHCFRVSRAQKEVDNWIVSCVKKALTQRDAWQALIRSDCDNPSELRDQEIQLRSRLDWLATEFADGMLTTSQLITATQRIKTNLEAVEFKACENQQPFG
jgi:Recombinase/Resolvase, N terminal domain